MRLDHGPHLLAHRVVGGDRGAEGDPVVLGDLGGDEADAGDVQVAVLAGEAQLGGEVLAHDVAVEERHRPSADLQQLHQEHVGEGGLARARQPGEEDGEPLPRARGAASPQLLQHLGEGEPGGNLAPPSQPLGELGGGKRLRRRLPDPVLGHEGAAVGGVDPLRNAHELDLEAARGAGEDLVPGPRRRAPDEEVAAAVVLGHDRVQQQVARARLARGERKQVEVGRARRVGLHHRLQAADARVVAGVPPGVGGHPELDHEARLELASGGEGQLVLGAVHHLAGVEGRDLAPAPLREPLTHPRRRRAQLEEVVVVGSLDALSQSGDADRPARRRRILRLPHFLDV